MDRSDVETRTRLPSDRNPAGAACISGMHRSGTSMVARLLHSCGVFLGPEDELSQGMPHNPEGNFENRAFVELNESILAHFGGQWDDPPRFPKGWELTPEVGSFLQRAENLLGEFRRQHWGWKDPRNSLTLPFWQRLIPDLKVIACVRNPLEVARSLFVRGDVIEPAQFDLWMTYYDRLLSLTRPDQRLVTHYRSYFHDPHAELRRVLNWLGVEASDEVVESACAHISAGLRHHYVGSAELIEAQTPDEVLSLYFRLCAEAGPIYLQARKHEAPGEQCTARANEVSVLMKELQQLRSSYNEILNSKSFRFVSWRWRLRPRK